MIRLAPQKTFLALLLPAVLVCAQFELAGQEFIGQAVLNYRPVASGSKVAPGQIISITVPVSSFQTPSRVPADSFPLPTTLAGFTVTLVQTASPKEIPLPFLGVSFIQPYCSGFSNTNACGSLARLDVQVPYELVPDVQVGEAPIPNNEAGLIVRRFGISYPGIGVVPSTDSVHLIEDCDSIVGFDDPFCRPLVFHADGSRVAEYSPAKTGETLIVYSFGLGRTDPPAATGRESASDQVPTVSRFVARFDFAPFSTFPEFLREEGNSAQVTPQYSGLVKGYAGLYQFNIPVPSVPLGLKPCGLNFEPNAMLSIFGGSSNDSIPLCVVGQ